MIIGQTVYSLILGHRQTYRHTNERTDGVSPLGVLFFIRKNAYSLSINIIKPRSLRTGCISYSSL